MAEIKKNAEKNKQINDAEEVLNNFLIAWKKGNKGAMFRNCQKTWKANNNKAWLKILTDNRPENFNIISYNFGGIFAVDFTVSINDNQNPQTIRLINEVGPYKPGYGSWGVNPISAIKLIKNSKK